MNISFSQGYYITPSVCFSESVECSQLHVPCDVVSRIHEGDNYHRADTQRKMQIKSLLIMYTTATLIM